MNSPASGLPLIISDDGNVDHVLKMQGYFTGKFVAARDTTDGPTIRCHISSTGTNAHVMLIRELLLKIYGNDAVPFPYDTDKKLAPEVVQYIVGGGSITWPSDFDEGVKVRLGSITMRHESLREFPEDVEEQRAIIHSIKEWITEKIRGAGLEIDTDDRIR